MNGVLWVVAGVLAVAFLAAGLGKVLQPKEALAARMPWVEDFSAGQVRAIGSLEVLGAIGLIVPGILKVVPVLVPLAATGLALTMVGAAITHVRRKEYGNLVVNVVLFAMAVFVAWGRFGPYAF